MPLPDQADVGAALAAIDWARPWFSTTAMVGRYAAGTGDWRATLDLEAGHRDLRNAVGKPIRFVPQERLPAGRAYETHIYATGEVPTRANPHDFFNALIWLAFPRIKGCLNAGQASEISRVGIGAQRGPARDAATLFDENAVLFACSDLAMADALRRFDWQYLMLARRGGWGQCCQALVFGHALLEKLMRPYKSITAHAWMVSVDGEFFSLAPADRISELDRRVAASLRDPPLHSAMFAPIPVLGIPGWWPANEDAGFYADASVFRTGRRRAVAAC